MPLTSTTHGDLRFTRGTVQARMFSCKYIAKDCAAEAANKVRYGQQSRL